MTNINITEPALLIRIPKLFEEEMTDKQLYEATRGVWKVGSEREKAEYALCVANGVVQEVYRIEKWQLAGTTTYETRPQGDVSVSGRWEFVGKVAPDIIRNKYIRKSVADYFEKGNANPINYLNIK